MRPLLMKFSTPLKGSFGSAMTTSVLPSFTLEFLNVVTKLCDLVRKARHRVQSFRKKILKFLPRQLLQFLFHLDDAKLLLHGERRHFKLPRLVHKRWPATHRTFQNTIHVPLHSFGFHQHSAPSLTFQPQSFL